MQAPSTDELWISDVPRFGVVRAVIVDGPFAARFDDLNGDGREIEVKVYERAEDGWNEWGHQDDAHFPEPGGSPLHGWSGALAWVVGRGPAGDRVELDWAGHRQVVGVDAGGWWLAVIGDDLEAPEGESWSWPPPRYRVLGTLSGSARRPAADPRARSGRCGSR
jgi:hypothetical protein